jgi:predicted ATPase/DNA-binding CsgD family transcriptional regulator
MSQHRSNQLAGNLPDELSEFVGRRAEIAACKRALARSRLVTLTGPGGIGKTRLAMRVGLDVRRAVVDGVWLVELASLRDPALLAREVARSLGFSDRSTTWALATLLDHLRRRSPMLVLDNCEHLLDACAVLSETVLHSCPGVRMLTTSREPLGVAGEVIVPVPTMSVPSMDDPATPEHLLRSEAARLFTSRAAGVRPDFAVSAANATSVAELVRRLEGIPLAIELAAVRLRSLAPGQILDRLDNRFQLLSSGSRTAEARQKTMHATLEWSYALLTEAEQAMWRRASVFADSFDLGAAEAVCSGDGITADAVFGLIDGLIAKSVLICEPEHVPARYRMLDTVREFGEAKRHSEHETWLARRHRDWYACIAGQRGLGSEQVAWFDRLHADHANLRAALDFCVAHRDEANIGLTMACDLWLYWGSRGHLTEGRRCVDALLAAASGDRPLRARGLWVAGYLGLIQGDPNFAVPVLEQALSLAEGIDESAVAYASQFLGRSVWRLGDADRGLALTDQALASHRAADDWEGVVLALVQLGWMRILSGNPAHGRGVLRECIALCHAHSERWIASYALWVLGIGAWLDGAVEEAAELECEALTLKRTMSDEAGSLLCIEALAWIAVSKNQTQRGAVLLGAAAGAWQSLPGFLPQPLQEKHVACRDSAVQTLGSNGFDAAFASGRLLTPDQATHLALDELGESLPDSPLRRPESSPNKLTQREQQIATLLAEGMSNADIGRTLVVSARTAETHVRHIMDKLGFSTRAEIAAWAAAKSVDEQP